MKVKEFVNVLKCNKTIALKGWGGGVLGMGLGAWEATRTRAHTLPPNIPETCQCNRQCRRFDRIPVCTAGFRFRCLHECCLIPLAPAPSVLSLILVSQSAVFTKNFEAYLFLFSTPLFPQLPDSCSPCIVVVDFFFLMPTQTIQYSKVLFSALFSPANTPSMPALLFNQ